MNISCIKASSSNTSKLFELVNERWGYNVIPKVALSKCNLYMYELSNDLALALADENNTCLVGPISVNNRIKHEQDLFSLAGFTGILVPENNIYPNKNVFTYCGRKVDGHIHRTYFTYYPKDVVHFGFEYKISDDILEYASRHNIVFRRANDKDIDFFENEVFFKLANLKAMCANSKEPKLDRIHNSFVMLVDDKLAFFGQYVPIDYLDNLADMFTVEMSTNLMYPDFDRDRPKDLGRLLRFALCKCIRREYPDVKIWVSLHNEYGPPSINLQDCFLSCRQVYSKPMVRTYYGNDVNYWYVNRNYHRIDAYFEGAIPNLKLDI